MARKHTGYARGPHGLHYIVIPRPCKSIEYRSKVDDYPEDCQKLVNDMIDPQRRRRLQTAITRIFREARNYDQQWADDPKNPFPVEWLKNGLPLGLRPGYKNSPRIEKLSKQDDQVFRQLAEEYYSCRLLQGKKYHIFLEDFDKKYAEYESGHRYFYLFAAGISRLTNDRDLFCTILGFCHDEISDVAEKVVSDEIKKIYPDAYIPLRNFAFKLPTFEFKTLVMHAEVKGLLTKTNAQDKNSKKNANQGEWSTPMSKKRMMRVLRIDDYSAFNNFAKLHGIKEAGSRELYQICLDKMDKSTRAKLEKA